MWQMAFLYSFAQYHGTDYYFQDPKFFEGQEVMIKKLFGANVRPKTDMVAVHVRRGDYVNNNFYVDLMETDYYERAMEQFPDADFLIFSDDIAWCKRQAIFKDCEFSEGLDEEADMNLMASCIGHIVANSSFSFWGAYISPYSQKVIAPREDNYYNDGVIRTRFPHTWIQI